MADRSLPQRLQKPAPNRQSQQQQQQQQDKQDVDPKHTKAFDFTQRKRWADILVNEVSGAVLLVLSSAATVVFVAEAARELLNWSDTNVQGMEITALLHPDDVDPFSKAFLDCIRQQAELAIFVRLKSYHSEPTLNLTGGKWPLYEIRGHPHFGAPNPSAPFAMGGGFPQAECKAFFATARPYPTRGGAVLDSFLELKVENERLRRSLDELRISHPDLVAAAKEDAAAAAANASARRRNEKDSGPRSAEDLGASSSGGPFAYDFEFPPNSANGSGGPMTSIPATGEDVNMMRRHSVAGISGEDSGSRKRGKRKAAGLEQRVCHTCGRTDSPEWRKGPLGPKTLCNACGLRFSKKVKTKPSDPASNNDKDDLASGNGGDPGLEGDDGGLGDDDAVGGDAGGLIAHSPIIQHSSHHDLDYAPDGMRYDLGGISSAVAGPSSSKLQHQISARHSSFSSGLLPSPSTALPMPFVNNSSNTASHGPADNYFPVSMTMSMPNHLSAWFASGTGGTPTGSAYDSLPGGAYVGEGSIRGPQPKQALSPLQTHFDYDALGSQGSASASGHHSTITTASGAMYHHYQPPGGQV